MFLVPSQGDYPFSQHSEIWKRQPDSNWRKDVLQTPAYTLCHDAEFMTFSRPK